MPKRWKIRVVRADQAAEGDLFEPEARPRPPPTAADAIQAPPPHGDAVSLDDIALIAAIGNAGPLDCGPLADEAVCRQLISAIPALEALCSRFAGYGRRHAFPEQIAALNGLARLGGKAAGAAVERLVLRRHVDGAALADALLAAAHLGVKLPGERVAEWLIADDPSVREAACRLAVPSLLLTPLLIDLLEDLRPTVMTAASLALARQGRAEARPVLSRLLEVSPTGEIVEAAARVPDEPMLIRLGELAKWREDLRGHVIGAPRGAGDPAPAARRRLLSLLQKRCKSLGLSKII